MLPPASFCSAMFSSRICVLAGATGKSPGRGSSTFVIQTAVVTSPVTGSYCSRRLVGGTVPSPSLKSL